jgi:hypothetical protein
VVIEVDKGVVWIVVVVAISVAVVVVPVFPQPAVIVVSAKITPISA